MVRMHVADVDGIGPAEPLKGVFWRFVKQPPAPGKCWASKPGVKEHRFASEF